MPDLARIGITPIEVFQTLVVLAPSFVHHEKLSHKAAAEEALALLLACAEQVDKAFEQAPDALPAEDVGQGNSAPARDKISDDDLARDLVARQILKRQQSYEPRRPQDRP